MYQHILVAIDILESDKKVLATAANIAKLYNSVLTIVHVCESHVTGYGETTSQHHIANEMQIKQERYPQLKMMLDQAAPDLKKFNRVDTQLLFGHFADTIHLYAQQHQCDLIVVGSHGYTGVKALLDSTANKLLHGACCDIYTVRITD
jgi:universal stress protein A